jgi:hypothetical protein
MIQGYRVTLDTAYQGIETVITTAINCDGNDDAYE